MATPDVISEPIDDTLEEIGELDVAEYIVMLLAWDTYYRYLKEATSQTEPNDIVSQRGLAILRQAETQFGIEYKAFLGENLESPTHQKMLTKAFRLLVTRDALPRKALQIRMLLRTTATMRKVFKTNRALQEVRAAIQAAVLDDADAALDKFAVIATRNTRIKNWISLAAKTAGPGTFQNPVLAATTSVADDQKTLAVQEAQKASGPSMSGAAADAAAKQADRLMIVQQDAADAAKQAMAVSGEPDEPPTKSEVIGIATAAAAALKATDIPPSLADLEKEYKLPAALSDGRVLVTAGAGAGKTTTLVARVSYLVRDRKVNPKRILVASFNKKAAEELRVKIAKACGNEAAEQMKIGTLNGVFRSFVAMFGNATEKHALGISDGGRSGDGGFMGAGDKIKGAVNRAWEQCYGVSPPPAKQVQSARSRWSANKVRPKQAMAMAVQSGDLDQIIAAVWYTWYEGFKGSFGKTWKPQCEKSSKSFEGFMARYRPNGERLGDFDDQINFFHAILKRDPAARARVQSMFDHILVDECQDLNKINDEVIEMVSEHVTDGSDGKSVWQVGDDKQAIYGFRGARPDLFISKYGKEGWTTRTIPTNYRCDPEIVEAANKLISHNEGQIPLPAIPDPEKPRGVANITVDMPIDNAAGAIRAGNQFKAAMENGEPLSDYAVLARTRNELNAYETACLVRGVPYARKGTGSFLGSHETNAFLSYVALATGTDFAKMQHALGSVLNKPNRFFIGPDATAVVAKAISSYAARRNLDEKSLNPVALLANPEFRAILIKEMPIPARAPWKERKADETLAGLANTFAEWRMLCSNGSILTKELFDSILGVEGVEGRTDPNTGEFAFVPVTFRETIQADLKQAGGGEDDDAADDAAAVEGTEGLGNVSFMYELLKPDPTEPDIDASTPMGFKQKMERLAGRVKELRYDPDKWEKSQAATPVDQRKPPPGVYLGTVHSVKGAQWEHTIVLMPAGTFPIFRREPTAEEERLKRKTLEKIFPSGLPQIALTPEDEEIIADFREEDHLEAERRLGYVALTRAKHDLQIVCPRVNQYGKPAGPSTFVEEAGLVLGQNVKKPNETAPPPPVEPGPRSLFASADVTAAEHYVAIPQTEEDWA